MAAHNFQKIDDRSFKQIPMLYTRRKSNKRLLWQFPNLTQSRFENGEKF